MRRHNKKNWPQIVMVVFSIVLIASMILGYVGSALR